MNKIKQIRFNNFKFFYKEVPLDIDRNNVLLFGENGSGKSSIYWGLYTFLQSVFKTDPSRVQKYFNPRHDENLRNRFASDNEESFIKVVFEDDQQSISEKTISNTVVNTKTGNLIKQATQGSELINYKLLSKIHDFKNPFQINLFSLMDKDSLMFINFREVLVRHDNSPATSNAQDWWEYIKPGLHPRGRMHDPEYQTFATAVTKFDQELKFYLSSIVESINGYLRKLKQTFTISFDITECTYDAFEEGSSTKRNHKTIPPKIFIHVHFLHDKIEEEKRLVTRPHTFLNEAKLTAIALSIRFAMLDQKIDSSQLSDDTPKILVLDDLLISLDMSNRDRVLDIILTEFLNYQIIILTHDRNFFELVRHKITKTGQENWKYFEMYECEKDDIPQPLIKDSETYLDKAEKYFLLKEYEIAGNFLRKEAEAFCKEVLPKRWQHTSEYNLHDLNGLVQQCLRFSEAAGLDKSHFEALDSYRKFVLNPSSHDSYDVPKFNSEIEGCLNTLKSLRELRWEPFLKRGDQVEFELTTADGSDTYKFEIILEDDFRILKFPNQDSVISKGIVNYWVYKNEIKTTQEIQHKQDKLKSIYDYNYNASDKTKNADFWEEVIITSTGDKLSSARAF